MSTSLLPDSKSSLTKFIPLEAHYNLLRSIKSDTTLEALRARFDADVVATARQRYLLEQAGGVHRDKLIDFIHTEGHLTDRVRMVMYFLFMIRDSRYRSFICNNVAGKDGRWDASVFVSGKHAEFAGVGGRKAFTNLRQLLVHANLLDDSFALRPTLPLDKWFPVAVEIAAPHITNLDAQQSFLTSPQAFLVKHHLHGLLNATVEHLASVELPNISEEFSDLLPVYSLGRQESEFSNPGFKRWHRSAPLKRPGTQSSASLTNPALLERANAQHFLLEEMMDKLCADNGFEAQCNIHVDLFVLCEVGTLLFEMKSCTIASARPQIRRAVNQVFEYAYL
ncbi:MAG: hypothetical protein WBP85_13320, partial [Terracidiphilus sp.]